MKSIPQVQKYMTTSPHTIGAEQPLSQAKELMTSLAIRHLPVLHGGKVVGLISDRDLNLISSFSDVDLRSTKVEDAMSTDPYTIHPDASLDEVALEMADKKYGSAVVVQNGHVVGIFTVVDALQALGELLQGRLGK